MAPGVGVLRALPAFSFVDVVDDDAVVSTALTSGGALGGQGQLLAAATLKYYVRRVPLVGLASRAARTSARRAVKPVHSEDLVSRKTPTPYEYGIGVLLVLGDGPISKACASCPPWAYL
jgi:hypothetical protein